MKNSEKELICPEAIKAKNNFNNEIGFHKEWYLAVAEIKYAYYIVYKKFKNSGLKRFKNKAENYFFSDDIIEELIFAADNCREGDYFEKFIVPGISGGAGTSINLNINEIIANIANNNLNEENLVHPIEHANIYQSTNDVIPSALKIAAMRLLIDLEEKINDTRIKFEKLEREFKNVLRIGYTQLQDAVPTTFGRLFSTYSDALSRDWWRVSKASERLKTLNLGGSAIGTSLTVPRFFLVELIPTLRDNMGLPIARAENLSDQTSNLDTFVEVHSILKSHSVNLEKIADDIRLLASDISGNLVKLQQKQIGSTIMPGKVNPVICEYIISCSRKIMANDYLITDLAARGNLELNAYLPTIGHSLLESLKLLISMNTTLLENMLKGIKIDTKKAEQNLFISPSISTALVPYLGYDKAGEIAKIIKVKKLSIFEINEEMEFLPTDKLKDILKSENLLKEGFSLKEIFGDEND